jgi:hypothetical protein
MSRFAIYAYEQMYQGYHGMSSIAIVEGDYDSACETAREMSFEVMDDYSEIEDSFVEDAEYNGLEEGTEEWDDYIAECRCDNVAYEVYRILDSCTLSNEECENMFYNDKDDFIEKYCSDDVG